MLAANFAILVSTWLQLDRHGLQICWLEGVVFFEFSQAFSFLLYVIFDFEKLVEHAVINHEYFLNILPISRKDIILKLFKC